MTESENDQLRRRILKLLYEKALKNPNDCAAKREELISSLSVPVNLIDLNMLYLHEKKLVKIVRAFFVNRNLDHWELAVITAKGIDVITHQEKYVEQFPFMQVNLQKINGPIYGSAIQAVNSQVSFSQQVTDAFKQVLDELDGSSFKSVEEKEEIKKNLKILQEEMQSKNADLGKIQKSWNWLKQNANWVVPTLTQVVIEGIKQIVK